MIPKDPERLIRQLGGFLSLNGFLRNVFLQDVHMNVDRTEGKGSAEDLVRAAECGKHDPAVGILCDLQRSRTEGKQRILTDCIRMQAETITKRFAPRALLTVLEGDLKKLIEDNL